MFPTASEEGRPNITVRLLTEVTRCWPVPKPSCGAITLHVQSSDHSVVGQLTEAQCFSFLWKFSCCKSMSDEARWVFPAYTEPECIISELLYDNLEESRKRLHEEDTQKREMKWRERGREREGEEGRKRERVSLCSPRQAYFNLPRLWADSKQNNKSLFIDIDHHWLFTATKLILTYNTIW